MRRKAKTKKEKEKTKTEKKNPPWRPKKGTNTRKEGRCFRSKLIRDTIGLKNCFSFSPLFFVRPYARRRRRAQNHDRFRLFPFFKPSVFLRDEPIIEAAELEPSHVSPLMSRGVLEREQSPKREIIKKTCSSVVRCFCGFF